MVMRLSAQDALGMRSRCCSGVRVAAASGGALTVAEAIVEVGGHSDGGEAQVDRLLEAGRHGALEIADVGRCGLWALVPVLAVEAVVCYVPLWQVKVPTSVSTYENLALWHGHHTQAVQNSE
jgi:hypothetical protein